MSKTRASSALDSQKAEAFGGRLLSALNNGAFCLMASIGHRTELFDAMRDQPSMASDEIAVRAGLNERYVREWLGAMVTAGVVDVDPATLRFSLPPEHAAFLTRAAAADNIAVFAQYIALLGDVEGDIVECFKHGGGVPYQRFTRFHDGRRQRPVRLVVTRVAHPAACPGPDRATGSRNPDARRRMRSGPNHNPARRAVSEQPLVGMDLSQDAITAARNEASVKGLENIEFVAIDLSDFHEKAESESFAFIATFDAVHDQAAPLNVLKGIRRALRGDGVYLMQDIKGSSHVHNNIVHPLGTFLYTVSCMHCMTVSLAQGGEGLGAMWGEEKTREYLERAGFRVVEKHELAHDIQNNWYVVRK